MATAVALQIAACSPAPRYVAVVAGDGDHVQLFDAHLSLVDSMAARTERSDDDIRSLAFSSGGEVLYLAAADRPGAVTMVRRYDGEAIARWELPARHEPGALALLPRAHVLLVTHYSSEGSSESGSLSFLSTRDLSESKRLDVCEGRPDALAVTRAGERAFVRCTGRRAAVVVVDLELRRVVTTAYLGEHRVADSGQGMSGCGAGGLALSPTETLLLVPCSVSGYLVYLDRLTQEPFDSVFLGPGIEGIAVSPRRPHGLLTSAEPATVTFVNLRTRDTLARIPLTGPPRSVAVSGDGATAVVSTGNHDTGTLLLLDMDARRVLSTIQMAGAGDVSIWPGRWSPVLTW